LPCWVVGNVAMEMGACIVVSMIAINGVEETVGF
jgi:hypothetical protein